MAMSNNGLTKLGEEAAEVTQIVMKLIAYPELQTDRNTRHPDGTFLILNLEDEIADVLAAANFVIEKLELDANRIGARQHFKEQRFWRWDGQKVHNLYQPPSYFAKKGSPDASIWCKCEMEWIALAYVQALAAAGDVWLTEPMTRERVLTLLTKEQRIETHDVLTNAYSGWFSSIAERLTSADGAFSVGGKWAS